MQDSSMRAVVYPVVHLRVSQADEIIESQHMKILKLAKAKGIEVVEFFADTDGSNTTLS